MRADPYGGGSLQRSAGQAPWARSDRNRAPTTRPTRSGADLTGDRRRLAGCGFRRRPRREVRQPRRLGGRVTDLSILQSESNLRYRVLCVKPQDYPFPRRSRGRSVTRIPEWGLPFPQPVPGTAAPLDAAVLADRPCLGRACRAGWLGIWHALDAPDEGGADLQEDGKPARRSAPTRTYEARKHRSLSRNRGRRRSQHFGAGRALRRHIAALPLREAATIEANRWPENAGTGPSRSPADKPTYAPIATFAASAIHEVPPQLNTEHL